MSAIHYGFLYHCVFDRTALYSPIHNCFCVHFVLLAKNMGERPYRIRSILISLYIVMLAQFREISMRCMASNSVSHWLRSDLLKLVENIYELFGLQVFGFHKQYHRLDFSIISPFEINIYLFIYTVATTFLCLWMHTRPIQTLVATNYVYEIFSYCCWASARQQHNVKLKSAFILCWNRTHSHIQFFISPDISMARARSFLL